MYIVMPYIAIIESVDEPNENTYYKFYIKQNMRDNWFEIFELKFLEPVNQKIKKEEIEKSE